MSSPASSGHASGNSTASHGGGGGGGGGPSAFPLLFAKRTAMNETSMRYYAAALSGLMGVLILFHLIRRLSLKSGMSKSFIAVPFVAISRLARNVLIRKAPCFPSVGHLILAVVFVGINLTIAFTNMDNKSLGMHSNVASRTGWMSISNVGLGIFLAMKNTPLSYLTAWSHERINVLHRIVGYTTTTLIIIHACSYASYFGSTNNLKRLRVNEEIFGAVAGSCAFVVAFSAIVIRRFYYELFYIMHILFVAALIVFVALHQPEVSKKIWIATVVASSLWFLDRCIRFFRVALYSINNTATLHPLPHGLTRVVLKKGPSLSRSGSHCFLWIPAVRTFELHPFTIVSNETNEFVIASYDGFTRDLYRYAANNPDAVLRASVEGPYGTFPNPSEYDRILLIGGGSGASFTFGVALEALKSWPWTNKKISFHWIVKNRGYFAGFSNFIKLLRDSKKVDVTLHVTRGTPSGTQSPNGKPSGMQSPDEKPTTEHRSRPGSLNSSASSATSIHRPNPEKPATEKDEESDLSTLRRITSDPEKADASLHHTFTRTHTHKHDETDDYDDLASQSSSECDGTCGAHLVCLLPGIHITSRRPDVVSIIREEIAAASPNERILVIGCGPQPLMTAMRNATAQCIRPGGPGIELHCEHFGW